MDTVHVFSCFCLGVVLGCGRIGWKEVPVDPEVNMNTSQLITSKGYPCEEYDVITSDGYILSVQRIPHGKTDQHSGNPRPVVMLQHGLLSCSACWVENLANQSLGFILADAGFDVWLGNSRGNTYARRHKTLNPDQKEFWAFSWDEMALYDVPATVDKILSVTGAEKIFYAGHSQGGAVGYAALTANQTLASKVKMFAAMAPAVYVKGMISPVRKLIPYSRDFIALADMLGMKEFLPYGEFYKFFAEHFCNQRIPSFICENIMFVICGYDPKQLNITRIPVYIGQHPAGTSVQNIAHFAQMEENDLFQRFDYGPAGNMRKYNQTTPPFYNISTMNVPVALFHGGNDWLIVPPEITKLQQQTKNLVYMKQIQEWDHLDFMWAMNGPSQCYDDIITLFRNS